MHDTHTSSSLSPAAESAPPRYGTIHQSQPLHPMEHRHSLRDALEAACRQYAELDAYLYRVKPGGPEVHISYTQLLEDLQSLTTALLEAGVPQGGARVAVIGENSYAWVLSFNVAAAYLGLAIPLDHQLPDEEAIGLLQRAEANVLCYSAKHGRLAEKARETCPRIEVFCKMDMLEAPSTSTNLTGAGEATSISEFLARGRTLRANGDQRYRQHRPAPDDVASIIFTSGTTNISKGVMLTHENITTNLYAAGESFDLKPGKRALSVLPLHHTYENTAGMYSFLVNGCTICINDGLRYIASNLKDWQISYMIIVPAIAESIYHQIWRSLRRQHLSRWVRVALRLARRARKERRRLIFRPILRELGGNIEFFVCGGAPVEMEVLRFFDTIGLDCLNGYGLTEASPVIATNLQGDNHFGSVGKPLPYLEVCIDEGEAIDDGEGHLVGEILARGHSIMKGYLGMPEETAQTIDKEGWLHTGDLGYFDKNGVLYLTGRIKTMLVLSNGKKAFPEEIELLLNRVPGIAQSFVWVEEDQRGQTMVCAKLQLRRKDLPLAETADDEDIAAWCKDAIHDVNAQMPPYKAITAYIWTEEAIQMTSTLKVRRKAEKASIEQDLAFRHLRMQEASGLRIPSQDLVFETEEAAAVPVRTPAVPDNASGADKALRRARQRAEKARRQAEKAQGKAEKLRWKAEEYAEMAAHVAAVVGEKASSLATSVSQKASNLASSVSDKARQSSSKSTTRLDKKQEQESHLDDKRRE